MLRRGVPSRRPQPAEGPSTTAAEQVEGAAAPGASEPTPHGPNAAGRSLSTRFVRFVVFAPFRLILHTIATAPQPSAPIAEPAALMQAGDAEMAVLTKNALATPNVLAASTSVSAAPAATDGPPIVAGATDFAVLPPVEPTLGLNATAGPGVAAAPEAPGGTAPADGVVLADAVAARSEDAGVEAAAPVPGEPAIPRRKLLTRRRACLAVLIVMLAGLAFAYQNKSTFSAQGADLSRKYLGDERTARIESWYFTVQDRIDKLKFKVMGGTTDPFAHGVVLVELVPQKPAPVVTIDILRPAASFTDVSEYNDAYQPPAPMVLPKTTQLRDNPEADEGVWSTSGLPRANPGNPLMAKTFLRPDKSRPYAIVAVLLMDSRRIRLNLVGGTVDPGGDRGVKGPGLIPADQYPNLLAAWNGGFKGPHGNYGMFSEGKEYRPMRAGLATIAVYKDGSIKMGEWGSELTRDENMVAARQNAVLLIKDGEISKRVAEGNDTWGYVNVNSAEFITWRSAVGLTKDGNLLYASGNSLSAETLAKALQAAGAYTAMQLDINTPYVLLGTFFQQPDGTLKTEKFMSSMSEAPSRFLKTQERDFMYVTYDDTNFGK